MKKGEKNRVIFLIPLNPSLSLTDWLLVSVPNGRRDSMKSLTPYECVTITTQDLDTRGH